METTPWSEEMFAQHQEARALEIESGSRRPRPENGRQPGYVKSEARELQYSNPGMTREQSIIQAKAERVMDVRHWHRHRLNRQNPVVPAPTAPLATIPTPEVEITANLENLSIGSSSGLGMGSLSKRQTELFCTTQSVPRFMPDLKLNSMAAGGCLLVFIWGYFFNKK